ncbi:UvrB/UvrC motif-containing protein [Synechocystis sp. B12]|nr:UvrB/UvrC motif-containing protein [Synechocystis sp. B12]
MRQILKEKDDAVRNQDFEQAGELKDREDEIKKQIRAIASSKKRKGITASRK